ncbi:DUF6760 family protein [Streptomyces sp. NPDC048340]|uniref:DUF6760 family protein n=2 Tax=unclassified Streptomyces TaxID=2593676 RepID=UPI0037162CD2
MSGLSARIHRGHREPPGGMKTYAAAELRSEIAYIAYHFHWSHNELLDMDHIQRRAYIQSIADINQLLDDRN